MKNINKLSLLMAISILGATTPSTNYASEAVQQTSKDVHFSGNYLSGQFAREHGDVESAIHYLRKVQQQDPGNTRVISQLLGMLLLQGKIDYAVELASTSDKAHSNEALSVLLVTLKDIKENKLDDAAATLEQASESGPVQLWQPLMAAWLDLGRHKITKPLIIEQFSVDVGKAAPLVNYHLALINEQAGFIDAATQNFKNAVEDPQNPPGLVIGPLLRFYAQHNKPDALQAIVKNYTKLHPEAANIQGIPVITTAKDGVAEVLYAMGGIMLGADITNDAVIYLQMTLYINPDFTDAALALGDAYVQLQQYDMANASYSKVKPDQQAYVKAQLEIAVNEDRLGKLDAALARLDKMEQHSTPAAAASLITRGDLLRTHMRYAEAIDAYTKAMGRVPELNVTYWPVLFARASCYERLGKWHDAEQDLQQALKLSPNQPDILNYLGYGWLEHGVHLAEARTMIETAFKASPNNAEIADSMGWSLYLQGHYEKAAEFIEKAVELLPGDPTVNDHLGDVYWRLGRKTEARYQWQRSLSFAPEQPLTNNLQRKIKDGLPAASTSDTVSDLSGDAPVKLATP